jgi:hypothetical protein
MDALKNEFDIATLAAKNCPEVSNNFLQELIADWYVGPSVQSRYISELRERRFKRKFGDILAEYSANPEASDLVDFFGK